MAKRCDLVPELSGSGDSRGLTILIAGNEFALRLLVGQMLR